jgi:hypothetical protein
MKDETQLGEDYSSGWVGVLQSLQEFAEKTNAA